MALIKQKTIHDAGTTVPTQLNVERDDQGGEFVQAPRSSYAINETVGLVFTENTKVLEGPQHRLTIADGGVRPGTV